MAEEEIGNLCMRIAFQYESAIGQFHDKKIDQDLADRHKNAFYDSLDVEKLQTSQKIRNYTEIIRRNIQGMICENMVSLTELARQYSEDSP